MVYLRKDCILREEYDTILNRICPYCTVALSCPKHTHTPRRPDLLLAVMKTSWQDKNCPSPSCALCFWMSVAASSRSTEAVEHIPEDPNPAPEHRGPSYLSLFVNNNSSQRPFQAISGLSWHILKTQKIKELCTKLWEKVWRSSISSWTKSLWENLSGIKMLVVL